MALKRFNNRQLEIYVQVELSQTLGAGHKVVFFFVCEFQTVKKQKQNTNNKHDSIQKGEEPWARATFGALLIFFNNDYMTFISA